MTHVGLEATTAGLALMHDEAQYSPLVACKAAFGIFCPYEKRVLVGFDPVLLRPLDCSVAQAKKFCCRLEWIRG